MNRVPAALLVLAFAAACAAAQPVAEHALGRPLARSSDNFTEVVGAHELPDGRLLVVDLRERRIALLDLARGTSTPVAREGQGPLEYDATFSSISWLGDTVLVYGRNSLLRIAPNGTPATRMSGPQFPQGSGGRAPPRFADREGRLYFEMTDPLVRDAAGGFVAPLRGPVVRWNPRTGSLDTMAIAMHRDPVQPLVRPWRPYAAKDGVGVLPDGRVVIVRAAEYRVEFWRDNRLLLRGPVIPTTPIRVTAAERDAFRDERARAPAGSAQLTGPPRPTSESERAEARRQVGIPDEAFPATLPPIVETRPVLVHPDGTIWVLRSSRATDTSNTYDVFNDRGVVVKRVTVPGRGRVVGFGRTSIYVATPDADDVLWIGRHAAPGGS